MQFCYQKCQNSDTKNLQKLVNGLCLETKRRKNQQVVKDYKLWLKRRVSSVSTYALSKKMESTTWNVTRRRNSNQNSKIQIFAELKFLSQQIKARTNQIEVTIANHLPDACAIPGFISNQRFIVSRISKSLIVVKFWVSITTWDNNTSQESETENLFYTFRLP